MAKHGVTRTAMGSIGSEHLEVYRKYGGDDDGFSRVATNAERTLMREVDWADIRDAIRRATLMDCAFVAPEFAREFHTLLRTKFSRSIGPADLLVGVIRRPAARPILTEPLSKEISSMIATEFSFLCDDLGYTFCGVFRRDGHEPRDADTIARYVRGDRYVDVVVTEIAYGLFVGVGRAADPIALDEAWSAQPIELTSFEQFLLTHHAEELEMPLHGMGRHKVFMTMYNESSRRYATLMSKHLPQAIAEMARRFRRWGMVLVED